MREENGVKPMKEGKEVMEVKGKRGGVAAFFDLDGTLMALPSLERRFFWMLRYRKAIPRENYLLWLAEAVKLAPRGLGAIRQSNKMYLRGVQVTTGFGGTESPGGLADGKDARRAGRGRMRVPRFFPEAMERVAWHARQGHAIVLVSGTLEPLASEVAFALVVRLAAGGIPASIGIWATKLEEAEGQWTGHVLGEAMWGEAKGRAVKRLAEEEGFDLPECYGYGDSANDRWLLEAVGNPVAVNPSHDFVRMARERGWPVLWWQKEKRDEAQRRRAHSERLLVGERREFQG